MSNFITEYVDGLIEGAKPGASKAAMVAQVYAEETIRLLRVISDNTREEEYTEKRIPVIWALTNGVAKEVSEVPAGQDWFLENVVIVPAGATVLSIGDVGNAVPRFAKSYAATDTTTEINMLFKGGSQISLLSTGADAQIRATFRTRQRSPSPVPAVSGQLIVDDPYSEPYPDEAQAAELADRHASPLTAPGLNVHGERRPESSEHIALNPAGPNE